MKLEELLKIAQKNNMTKRETLLFMAFYSKRFPNLRDKHYADEWAKRIKNNKMSGYADAESMRIFRHYMLCI